MMQVLGSILAVDDQLIRPVPDAKSAAEIFMMQNLSDVSFLNLVNEVIVDNLRAKLGASAGN